LDNNVNQFVKCRSCMVDLQKHYRKCPYCGTEVMPEHGNTSIEEKKQINDESISYEVFESKRKQIVDDVVRNYDIQQNYNRDENNMGKPYHKHMSNKKKVLIVALACIIPLIGQIYGFIAGIAYKSSDNEELSSFGSALTTCSLIVFVFQSINVYISWLVLYAAIYK
jgi:hypothetical protein